MATQSKADELSRIIEELKQERQQHVDAIERIDSLCEQYGIDPKTLTGNGAASRSPSKSGSTQPARRKTAGGRSTTRKRRKGVRGSYSRTGEESVLAFVKQHGSPTAKEVNEHWQAEGRGGKADSALSKLVADGRLKRVKNKSGRGSRYHATRSS